MDFDPVNALSRFPHRDHCPRRRLCPRCRGEGFPSSWSGIPSEKSLNASWAVADGNFVLEQQSAERILPYARIRCAALSLFWYFDSSLSWVVFHEALVKEQSGSIPRLVSVNAGKRDCVFVLLFR